MVTPSGKRSIRYKAKIDGNTLGDRFAVQKNKMSRNQFPTDANNVLIELQMKAFLANISDRLNQVYYIVVAKEVNKLAGKYTGETLIKELRILDMKWTERGLNPITLEAIKKMYVSGYTPAPCEVARFDVGRFDISCFGA